MSQKNRSFFARPFVLIGIGAGLAVGLALFARSGEGEHATFDAATGRFAPCPDSPNCVNSQQSPTVDEEHGIAPLTFQGSAADAIGKMAAIVKEMPRTELVTQHEEYLYVTFRSRIFRFVDDVEFYADENTGELHFRSASRLGYSDMGVNRKRMEEIRGRFNQ